MDRQALFSYVKDRYGVEPEYPWADDNAVLRRRENRKWFALMMAVPREKLGLSGEGTMDVMNVKCDPLLVGALRQREGFHPAWHMNKEKWITVRLDGSVPEEEVISLINLSFDLTAPKTRNKIREES